MAITQEELLNHIASMTVLELSQLVKAFEEKFGVSAAPVMAAGMMPAAVAAAPVVEEKTEFDVIIKSAGEKKINVIKVIREITSLGLKEAKDAAEQTPHTLKHAIGKQEAEDIKKKLEEQGAVVEIK